LVGWQLHTLDTRGNPLVGAAVRTLATAVAANPSRWQSFNAVPLGLLRPGCGIEKLDLAEQAVGSAGATVLAVWLLNNRTVREVSVDHGLWLSMEEVRAHATRIQVHCSSEPATRSQ
jgi:hypothetical protein